MTESTKTRHIRTPREIAQDELDKASARLERAEKRHEKAQQEVSAASREVTAAKRVKEYAAQHPDLQPEPEQEPLFDTTEADL